MKDENEVILEKVAFVLPIFHRLFDGEVGVTVADTQKIVKYLPAKDLDFHTPLNSPIADGSGLQKLMRGKLPRLTARIGKELYGVTYTIKIGAIYNSANDIIGALAITQTTGRQETLKEVARKMLDHAATLTEVSEQIKAKKQKNAGMAGDSAYAAKQAGDSPSEENRLVGSIEAIADQKYSIGQELRNLAQALADTAEGF